MANHLGPESCVCHREVGCEALTGETGRPAIEPRNLKSGTPTLLRQAEGNIPTGVNRKPEGSPTRSETLSMPGSYLSRSWEVSSVPDGISSGGAGKGNRNPAIHADEKSDIPIVPRKSPNHGCSPAEAMEGRGIAAGNAFDSPACRTQSRVSASMGFEGIRDRAKQHRREKFTALHHHIPPHC